MPLDANIILQSGNPTTQQMSPAQAISLKQMANQMQLQNQQQQQKNAIAALSAQPDSIDTSTGLPSAQYAAKAFQISPEFGMKVQQQRTVGLNALSAENIRREQMTEKQVKLQKELDTSYVNAYDQQFKRNGGNKEDATNFAKRARLDFIDDNERSGMTTAVGFTPDQIAKARSNFPDIEQVRARVTPIAKPAELLAEKRIEQTDRRLDDQEKEAAKRDALSEKRFNATMANRGSGSASGGFEGKNGEILASLAEKGVSLPAGFRSKQQQLGLLNALSKRNPDLTADQIADKIKSGQIDLANLKVEGRTAANIAGKISYASNEIEQTIPLVREASAKLPRGEFLPYNKLKQMGEKEFSNPDLAEFRMYMTSLSNAYDMLAARGGTDAEKRAENRKNFDTATSPEALEGVMRAIQKEAQASGTAAAKSVDVTHKGGSGTAPPAALDHLKTHPELKDAFKAKYGYLPIGGDGSGGGGGSKPVGLIKEGNIDIHHRPVVHNQDGSISTVKSMISGFEENGKEYYYVFPRVVGDKVLSEDEAIDHFRKSHEFLGKFDTVKNADKFAQKLHEQQASEYLK